MILDYLAHLKVLTDIKLRGPVKGNQTYQHYKPLYGSLQDKTRLKRTNQVFNAMKKATNLSTSVEHADFLPELEKLDTSITVMGIIANSYETVMTKDLIRPGC